MINQKLFEHLVDLRRDIHQNPEIEFDVQRTAGIAAEEMRRLDLKVRTEVGQTGVVADLEVPGATRRIALRADMDALPMDEENDLPFKSKVPGKAHMCGHDAHTAMLIGAANVLAEHKDSLNSSVRFIFQPSEEKPPGGAPAMIADGALEDVDQIYALHVWPWTETGEIGICQGRTLAQADEFHIRLSGKGGHAAAPHLCNDPVIAATHMVQALQSIVARNVDPLDAAVLSVSSIQAGHAHNVIPESCKMMGTVRTYRPEVQAMIRNRMETLVRSIADAFQMNVNFDYIEGYPPVINHPEATAHASAAGAKVDGLKVNDSAREALFGEDFAFYGKHVPSCFIQLGCRNESLDAVYGLHNPKFKLDEECIRFGSSLLAQIAL